MQRPTGTVIGLLVLLPLVLFVARPGAVERQPAPSPPAPVAAPGASFVLGGCPAVEAREAFERQDCLQSVRLELMDGRIDLSQALAHLEACAGTRPELEADGRRLAELRLDRLRARAAYGELLDSAGVAEWAALEADIGAARPRIPEGAVRRLRAAGIDPSGIEPGRAEGTLRRLRGEASLRADFRAVFGDRLADDLEAAVSGEVRPGTGAMVLGETVIVPNRPPVAPAGVGPAVAAERAPEPLAASIDAYTVRLVADLRTVEVARLRYLASAAAANHRTGSVRTFVSSLRRLGAEDEEGDAVRQEVERDREALLARLANLERRLGADPLIVRMAGEGIGLATGIAERCQAEAQVRRRWIRGGAAVVTGLVGAAGVVVVTGATGTLIGGVTIAAALEASVGAYLIARSERVGAGAAAAQRDPAAAETVEEQPFIRPEGETELEDGSAGSGGGAHEEWFDDLGEALELDFHDGEGIEEESGESTEARPRENVVPPILPLEVPEELRELPPMLEGADLNRLRELSLPEIQDRIDEFLSMGDPRAWALAHEGEEALEPTSLEAMIEEAKMSLSRWERRRELAERFGPFFIHAELERLPAARRPEVLLNSMGRYLQDRELYGASTDVEELRRRVASRLVMHCRAGASAGDLVLSACTDETALSVLLVAALRDAGIPAPDGTVLAVQAYPNRFEAVLYAPGRNEVYSLTRGVRTEGVVAPLYHPATFYYGYLLGHQVVPEIDVDRHLLIALPDRPLPAESVIEVCEEDRRNVMGRAVEWLGSMIGVRRVSDDDPCGGGATDRNRAGGREGGVDVNVNLPLPRNPLQRAGGGQSGSGQGGGGSGGGSPLATGGSRDPSGGGGTSMSTRGEPGGEGSAGEGSSGGEGEQGARAEQGGEGAGEGAGGAEGTAGSASGAEGTADGSAHGAAGDPAGRGEGGGEGENASTGSGGSGGYGLATPSGARTADLAGIGRETSRLARAYERQGGLRVMPWRLREDEGMMTGSTSQVLYADNDRALQRFQNGDLFLTLSPAEVEAQRRMLEADAHPIFPAGTECGAPNLPPRRVFRRAATGEAGFRYVYCDQDEAMVVFRDRKDAESYASLSAPDRPLYLARLASERVAHFERSPEVVRLRAFLADPNVLREYSRDELFGLAKTANELLVFQNALESALVQSMTELGESGVRSYYYEMHRQVLQAPFFIGIAEAVYRLNQRLASDPLQSLAWANAQPARARQGFFDLYHTLGGVMDWPDRWSVLQRRYGASDAPPPARDPAAPSLDFLQILSDPTRVRVDWTAERTGDPSIRDRQPQEGVTRTSQVRPRPSLSELLDREDAEEHRRGGTGGLGRSGTGESFGPEEGRRPLQMIHIRIVPDEGDPDHHRLPEDNQVRPGGTEGRQRTQTEESATRQEPVLWLAPTTFVQAVLSTWDGRDLRPATAGRVPPLLRLDEELRELFLRQLHPTGVYDNRLRTAMGVFAEGGWLRYAEVREAMGGAALAVKAHDTGRFSGAYSGNPPINDQDQIRIPNFFTAAGVIIPADLFEPVREHYTRAVLGIFDLAAERRVEAPASLRSLPVPPGEGSETARGNLLRSLEIVREQAGER